MQIFKTTNYDSFKSDVCNRQVGKLKKLMKSMKKYGFLSGYPILVEKKKDGPGFLIKDGQHRFETAKLLKLPIFYTIHEGKTIEIAEINDAQRPWALRDYLGSFCQQGRNSYAVLSEYCKNTGIGISQASSLLSGECASGHNQHNSFKAGTFKITDTTYAMEVGDLIIFLGKYIKWNTDALLVQSLSRVMRVEEFKTATFKERVKSCPGNLVKFSRLEQMMEMLERAYNYKSRSPIPLKFLADQAMRKRTFFHHASE